MRRFINIIIVVLFCLTLWPDDADARGRGGRSYSGGGTVYVRGHIRNGTYVRPYTRSAPTRRYTPYAIGAAAGVAGAAYLPSASASIPPVEPDPVRYASPSSASASVAAVPAPPPAPTSTPNYCIGKGWCYIITRADGVIEAAATPTMDISYPPGPNTKPYRALIYNNQ